MLRAFFAKLSSPTTFTSSSRSFCFFNQQFQRRSFTRLISNASIMPLRSPPLSGGHSAPIMRLNPPSLCALKSSRRDLHSSPACSGFLHKMHMRGVPDHKAQSWDKKPIQGHNFLRGTVLQVVVRHPKKPNSGNRKCAIVRLSNGIETCAYIPGENHNVQDHSQVLVRGGRRRDLIGVKSVIMRGKLDCSNHKNPKKHYGVKYVRK